MSSVLDECNSPNMVADAKASRGDIIVVEKFFLSLVRRGVSNVSAASIASTAEDVLGLFGEIDAGRLDIVFGRRGLFFFDFLNFDFETGVVFDESFGIAFFCISVKRLFLACALEILRIFEFQ